MRRLLALLLLAGLASSPARAASLEDDLGRSEVRIRSAPFVLPAGRSLEDCALSDRLARLGYRRVKDKPDAPGEWFFGTERAWVYRRACRFGGEDHEAELFGLQLRRGDGAITGALDATGRTARLGPAGPAWLPPETLSESLTADSAPRILVRLKDLPEHAWRAVLAAEDHRFFEHEGVDPRSLARAALANVTSGGVAQGGSTITQQLVKNRDLTPKRTLGRKVSEAVRALALEAEHSKEEILEAYLNCVYFGHVKGLAIHGIGAGARAWFSKDAADLTLAESALLAAMIQGPNRLAPDEHADRAKERRDWVLSRMQELGYVSKAKAEAARSKPVSADTSTPRVPPGRHVVAWAAEIAHREAPERLDEGRGVVVETTVDPWLQAAVERIVRERLRDIRRDEGRLRGKPVSAAVVVMDADSGDVLALAGGDPADREDRLDRARSARRQPGSTIKPLLLLEALDRCGNAGPLLASTRIADEPLTVTVPDGTWSPENSDDEYHGVVTLRDALVESLNVPFARVALRCGLDPCAATLRRLGLDVPEDPPPSLALGAIEETPLQMARAYCVLASGGRLPDARPVARIERPGGRGLAGFPAESREVASAEAAWIVTDMMQDAVRRGTAAGAAVAGITAAAKTGTSSERRDAWLAGHAGGVVVVAWFGVDDGSPLGMSGAAAAGPAWREILRDAVMSRAPAATKPPEDVVVRAVNPEGLLVPDDSPRGRTELFKRGVTPRRARWWRADEPDPIVR